MRRHRLAPGLRALALCALAALAAGRTPIARAQEQEARLDEVVVRVPRAAPGGAGAAASVVDARRFEGEAKSVAELVATAPGVAVNDYGGLGQLSTVSVRGAEADGVRVLLDGLPLSSAAGAVNLSSIPRQWISRIEVVRGAEGARYGAGALGGAVNVVTRRPGPGTWSSQLSYGSFGTWSAAADAGAGGDRWSAVLALGWDETNGDFTYVFDPRPTVGGDDLEARVRTHNAGRRGGALAKAHADALGGRVDLLAELSGGARELPGSPYLLTPDDRQDDLRGAVVARHAILLGGPFRVATELSARHDRLDTRLAAIGGTSRQRDSAAAAQVALAWTAGAHAGEVGVRAGGERLDASGVGARRERAALSAFASEELALAGGRVRVGPAARWDREGPYDGVSAKLGGSAVLAGPLSARASGGWTFRAPSVAELYLEQGGLAPNPDLVPEKAASADAALELAGRGGFARAGVFAALYRDLVVYEPDSFRRLKPFNGGKAAARGLELELASAPAGPLALAVSGAYTLLATEILRGGEGVLGNDLPHRARHRLYARAAGSRGPVEAHAEAHWISAQFQDRRNLLPVPAALTFHLGGAVALARHPDVRLHVDLRNVLGDRTLQDGFGNPLPGRMATIALRIAGGKDTAP